MSKRRTSPVVLRNRPDVWVGNIRITSGLLTIVGKVKPTSDTLQLVSRFCHSLNIGWEEVEGQPGWYVFAGHPNDIKKKLTGRLWLIEWHAPDNRTVQKGSGAGETRRKAPPKPDFEAIGPAGGGINAERHRMLDKVAEAARG